MAAIGLAVAVQLFNDFACYQKSLLESLMWLWFPLIPLTPAVLFLQSANPLRAVTAALVVIPFYALAYYTDCVLPYTGGGASMVYVIVLFYGLPTALATGLLTGPLCRWLDIRVAPS